MPFGNPERKKLEQFRENFLFLTSDGTYAPHRQQRLFQWCQKAGLDWDKARQFVRQDAARFLKQVVVRVIADGKVTPDEIAGLRRLQRRLGLVDDPLRCLEQLYGVVEQKIESKLVERAAYLSASGLIDILKREIAAYNLPAERASRLYQVLERQHVLAKLMAGEMPVVKPGISLYKDEVCHYDAAATYVPTGEPARETIGGRLVITNMRLMMLSPTGGVTFTWSQMMSIVPQERSVTIVATLLKSVTPEQREHAMPLRAGTVYCEDPQYVATLIAAARKAATTAPPTPARVDRKLPQL